MTAPLFDGLAPLGADDATNDRIVRVAMPVPIDRTFDYRLAGDQPDARPGMRVRATFAGQQLVGLVVPADLGAGDDAEDAESGRPRALARIEAVIDEEPVVPESMIRWLAEAADEIFAPIGLALAHALPPGSTPRTARPYALTPRGERLRGHTLATGSRAAGVATGAKAAAVATRAKAARVATDAKATKVATDAKATGVPTDVKATGVPTDVAASSTSTGDPTHAVLELLGRRPQTLAELRRALPDGALGACLENLQRDGLVERRREVRPARARLPTERVASLSAGVDVDDAIETALARAPKQQALLRAVAAAAKGVPTRRLAARFRNANATLRSLAERGLVRIDERPRLVATETVLDGGAPVTLTDDQRVALAPIQDAIKRQVPERFLLHGVTGSGKTEVYLRAIAETLACERQALVLVPEITLTHQIVARLRARFGDEVAVLHSGLRPGERLAQWERLRTGQTAIAVGARSALFAPLDALGLIVIDEEHDGAYKNDEGFRYHARDLAERRARAAQAPLVLGSATPSLETRHRADEGELRRLSLPRRVGGRPLPAVEIVDLAEERRKQPRGRKSILSRPLRGAIAQALDEGGQAILFLNRRGFSTRIFCFQCGHAERCDDCDVALVFHAGEHRLRCHYCDLVRTVPERCAGCGDPETALLGVGTERLEEEVGSVFPKARLLRLDRDVARRRGHTEKVLRALRDGTVDIVVGTQMVAKGHDFPGVQLVGVVAADIGLHLPDFRAAERTFQLLTQVAGRAGRAERPGRVVVQTFVPEHYALAPVATHDYEGFYREEIEHREALGYPPFADLARVVVSAEDQGEAHAGAERLADVARRALPEGSKISVLGPAPAPLAKLRGRHRFMLLVKGDDPPGLRHVAQAITAAARGLPRQVQSALDARPVNML